MLHLASSRAHFLFPLPHYIQLSVYINTPCCIDVPTGGTIVLRVANAAFGESAFKVFLQADFGVSYRVP